MGILSLNNLQPAEGCKKKKFRVGRGKSSCGGNKCGKGSNGNQQRSGYKRKWGFAGGQTPLCRQLPQYSRINNFRKNKPRSINLDLLNSLFKKNISEINTEVLVKGKVIKKNETYKIICGKKNAIPQNIKIYADGFSKSAEDLIKKNNGECLKNTSKQL